MSQLQAQQEIDLEAAIDAMDEEAMEIADDIQANIQPVKTKSDLTVTFYNTMTGESSRISHSMMRAVATERFLADTVGPDGEDWTGRLVWTADPKKAPTPWRGSHLCFLHPENKEYRDVVQSLGMGAIICKKATLASRYEAERHARVTHSGQWRALQMHREETRETGRDSAMQRQTDAILNLAGQRGDLPQTVYACVDCAEVFTTKEGLKAHSHEDELIPCEECGRKFRAAGLAIHKGREHR